MMLQNVTSQKAQNTDVHYITAFFCKKNVTSVTNVTKILDFDRYKCPPSHPNCAIHNPTGFWCIISRIAVLSLWTANYSTPSARELLRAGAMPTKRHENDM